MGSLRYYTQATNQSAMRFKRNTSFF